MFDAPIDGVYVWLGVTAVSLVVAGIALSLPTTVPPDAPAVAAQVDEVATSEHRVASTIQLDADTMRIRGPQLALRDDGVTARARLVAANAAFARTDSLRALLWGTEPTSVFSDRDAFRDAIDAARHREATWRPAPTRLQIRRVSWGEVDVTLLG